MNALGRFSSHEWIGGVDVPTAVVVTTKDKFVAPPRQLKLAQAIPGATVHPAHTDHAACVLGARRFIPALLEACDVGERPARRSGLVPFELIRSAVRGRPDGRDGGIQWNG